MPLAPVPRPIATDAMNLRAPSSKVRLTPSNANRAWYCDTIEFLVSFIMDTRFLSVSPDTLVITGNLPMNSGMNPYFFRSSCERYLYGLDSSKSAGAPAACSDPKPILPEPGRHLSLIMSPTPENAPIPTNSMLDVSRYIRGCSGFILPPWGGTPTTLPSSIFRRACCTPTPPTFLVTLAMLLCLASLSISSMNTMPYFAASALKSHFLSTPDRRDSTSAPTYPGSVSPVAVPMKDGTPM